MSSALVKLELKEGLGRHLRAGHPWVFRKGLVNPPRLPAGSVVDLVEGTRFVARGYYDPSSAIAVRVLTRDHQEIIDAAFFVRRIERCWQTRQELLDLSGTMPIAWCTAKATGCPESSSTSTPAGQ